MKTSLRIRDEPITEFCEFGKVLYRMVDQYLVLLL